MPEHQSEQTFYDTELLCSKCGERLYVPAIGVIAVLDSLKRTGMAGLVCICGQVQLIGTDFKPIRLKSHKTND
jgi:hypothetical protein